MRESFRKIWSAIFVCLFALCHGYGAGERVPLLAWHSIPEAHLSLERFQELADMGVTHSLMYYSPSGNRLALDYAHKVGLRIFVGDKNIGDDPGLLAEAVAGYQHHPALAGYTLRDEPAMSEFGNLSRIRDLVYKSDPEHWSYVNLLPTYASPAQLGTDNYLAHVRRFLMEFRPAVLSFDHYPVIEGPAIRSDYYRNLENIRQAALEYDTSFWAFALTCPHRPYPTPTEAHLRFQVWSNVAYGAVGIQYFTYWTPKPGSWDFHDAPIRGDGTRSPTYKMLKRLNAAIQGTARFILETDVLGIYHTVPVPEGCQGLDESSLLKSLGDVEAVVSLRRAGDGRLFIQFVNRSIQKRVQIKPELCDGFGWTGEIFHPASDLNSFIPGPGNKSEDLGVEVELEAGGTVFLGVRRL